MEDADDRFFTPRASARAGGYASSGDERFGTPRARNTGRSDGSDGGWGTDEFSTARCDLEEGKAYEAAGAFYDEAKPYRTADSREYGYYDEDDDDGNYGGQQQQEEEEEEELPDGITDADVVDIFSAARHNRVDDVERVLNRGVPVNVRDQFGNTILTISCQNGLKRMAKLALRRGADINTQNYRGNTPLHFAYSYGYDVIGEYLLSKGADGTVRNQLGLTCFEGIGASKTPR